MNVKASLLVTLFVTLIFCISAGFSQQLEHKEGEFIFQITTQAAEQFSIVFENGHVFTGVAQIDVLNENNNVQNIQPLFKFPPQNKQLAAQYGLDRMYIVNLPVESDIPAVAAEYENISDITYAEPNPLVKAHFVPNDTYYANQWGLNNTGQAEPYGGGAPVGTPGADIDAELAWNLHTGDNSIILSIIDTGVDYNHPDFSGRIVMGYDFANDDNDPKDDEGHGTCCAGIAGAKGNNGYGVAGVNWNCRIMPVKVLDEYGSGYMSDVADGIIYAADNGASVLSLSLGSSSSSSTVENAVNYAHGLDCVILASRGNNNNTTPNYPASYSNVIAIGAMSPCDERKTTSTCDGEYWWGSSYGNDLDVMAPGTRIYTTDITGSGGYASGDLMTYFNGTSAACPFAAGVTALLRSYEPSLSNEEVRTRLRETAVDMNTPGFDNQTGYGRINAYNALTGGGGPTPPAAPSNLVATAVSSSQIDLTWDDNSNNEDEFKIERSPNGSSSWTEIASVGANVTDFSNTGLVASTTYYYRVYASNLEGNSGYSNTADATTQEEGEWTQIRSDNFEAGFGNWNDGGDDCMRYTGGTYAHGGAAAIDIQDNSESSVMTTNNLSLANYEQVKVDFWFYAVSMDNPNEDFWLQISTNGGSSFTTKKAWARGTNFVNSSFYHEVFIIEDVSLTNTTQIRFRCDASGNGDDIYIDDVIVSASGTGGGPTLPTAPSNLVATAVSSSQIDLTWDDNSDNEDEFKIHRSPNGSSSWTQIATVGANVTSYSNTGLAASTTYYYRVRASNSEGNSDYSNIDDATTHSSGGADWTDDFNDGSASDWSGDSKNWMVLNNVYQGEKLYGGVVISIAPSASAMGAGTFAVKWTPKVHSVTQHTHFIFAYQNDDNYRYIEVKANTNTWTIVAKQNGVFSYFDSYTSTINLEQTYFVEIIVAVDGNVTLRVDGSNFVSHDFGNVITGEIGLGVKRAKSWFDDISVTHATSSAPLAATSEANQIQEIIPEKFELLGNFPNPFNPRTSISYSLPEEADVRLDIYNIRGMRVRTLVNTRQNAGHHNIEWNSLNDLGQRVTSGIYVYKLRATGTSQNVTLTGKMSLMK